MSTSDQNKKKGLVWSDFHPEMNLFDALAPEAFRKILGAASRITMDAGSVIIREGKKGESMYILMDGQVRVYKRGDKEEEIQLAVLGAGSVFGEMSLFDGQPSSATVLTTQESILLEIGRDDLFEFMRENPEIGIPLMHTLIYILSSRLRKANVHAASVASSTSGLGDALQALFKE